MKDFYTLLKSYYRTVSHYFKYLHLGFYYESLLAEMFSAYQKASSEPIDNEDNQTIYSSLYSSFIQVMKIPHLEIPFSDTDEIGLLYGSVIERAIQEVLSEVNNTRQSFFSYLIFLNSIFAISKATNEVLSNNEFEEIVKQEIFPHDLDMYNHFKAIIKFVRNTLAHNFYSKPIISQDKVLDIVVCKNDFERQKLRKINFFYDYSSPNSGMYHPHINRKISINLDLDSVVDGMSYHDLISLYQSFLIIFFCYDLGCKLGDKYLKGQQY